MNQNQHIAVRLTGVSKQYNIVDTARVSTVQGLLHLKNKKQLWALRGVSFEVQTGEAIGIIGPNGAGKSTILKILSGVTRPTEGKVEIFGTVASVLEIGLGFHPDLTGRENIFLSSSLLGFSKKHILNRFDDIVDFSEIHDFIDTPVKHYSSGMFIRLAFSLVANIEADIMLFDEALNVGDSAFQMKSTKKIMELIGNKKTVFIVSHNMNDITKLCNRVMHIENGILKSVNKPDISVINYLDSINDATGVQTHLNIENEILKQINSKCELLGVKIHEISVFPKTEKNRNTLYFAEEIVLQIILEKNQSETAVAFGFNFSHFGYLFLCLGSVEAKDEPFYLSEAGKYAIEITLPEGYLNTSVYNLDFFLSDKQGENTIEAKNVLCFKLVDKPCQSKFEIFRKHSTFSGPLKTQSVWKKHRID